MEVKTLTDLNTADIDDLIDVPGIGEVLAQRIIETRPFNTFDDVVRVKGIGSISLNRIAPYATVGNGSFPITTGDEKMETNEETRSPDLEALEALTETEVEETSEVPADLIPLPPLPLVEPWIEDEAEVTVEEVAEDIVETAGEEEPEALDVLLPPPLPVEEVEEEEEETIQPEEVIEEVHVAPLPADLEIKETPLDEPKKIEPPAPPAEKPAPKPATRGQITWLGFFIFILTLIAAVAVSMGILAGINGGLDYASPADVAVVSHEVNALKGRADALEQSLTGVQARLDNLEALSGRVDKLETATGDLQGELETLAAETKSLTSQVQDLNTVTETLGQQMEEVQAQSSRFQSLMDGLRDLLNNLFPTE